MPNRGATDARADAGPPLAWTRLDLGTPRVDLEDREALRRALDAP